MPKNPHPSEAADAAIIEAATAFSVYLRIRPDQKIVEQFATLAAAIKRADAIRADHPGRDVLVYALGDGRQIPVKRQPTSKETTMPKTKTNTAKPKATKAKAKAIKSEPAKAKAPRPLGQRAQIEADAMAGKLPKPPDFTANTHARFRPKLDEVIALVKAGDVKALKAFKVNPVSSSPKAIVRYRDLAIMALEAKAQ